MQFANIVKGSWQTLFIDVFASFWKALSVPLITVSAYFHKHSVASDAPILLLLIQLKMCILSQY